MILQTVLRPLFDGVFSRLPPRLVRRCGEHLLRIAGKQDRFFHTVDSLPKELDPARYNLTDPVTPEPPGRIAVVIQGPVLEADDFTLQTIRYYRRACPEMTVILSTWENGPAESINRCREAGAEVVLSRAPAVAGLANVNYQTTSTRAGIQRASELGAQFVAKTRSDQRLYAVHALYGLPAMLTAFPAKADSGQIARLVTSSFPTAKYLPFDACDHFMFGAIPDMRTFWSPPANPCTQSRLEVRQQLMLEESIERRSRWFTERYLMTEFLRAMKENPPFTIQAWWRVLADRFMVIECSQLDIYWGKYLPGVARQELRTNRFVPYIPCSFADWVRLVSSDPGEWRPPEWLLQLPPTLPAPARLRELPMSH